MGNLPPTPPTWRGSLGRYLVAVVSRALFWYTPQVQTFQRMSAEAAREQSEVLDLLGRMVAQLRGAVDQAGARITALEQENAGLKQRLAQVAEETAGYRALQNRVDFLFGNQDAALRHAPEPVEAVTSEGGGTSGTAGQARQGGSAPTAAPPGIDAGLYARFEDQFRGSRADIKERLAVYLDVLQATPARTDAAPILDIGCGRCEWLELLGENGFQARGVDTNKVFVEDGRRLGFDVTPGDGLAYLRSLPDACLGAVSAFHVVEHIDFAAKVELLDQSLRVLQPGGVLILETPNPENLLVSTKTFYYDPTHRQPVPSDFLKFLLEARGFATPEVIALHPYPASIHLSEKLGPLAGFLNYYFYGCQDYAVLARKA